MNKIIIYEGNSIAVYCTIVDQDGVDADMDGFDALLTIKLEKDSTDVLLSVNGTITDNVIEFDIAEADNTLDIGVYYYEVSISDATDLYTLTQDRLVIKESLVYIT